MHQVVQFHTEHKFLLMAYSQKELRGMGKIVADPGKRNAAEVVQAYEEYLYAALKRFLDIVLI